MRKICLVFAVLALSLPSVAGADTFTITTSGLSITGVRLSAAVTFNLVAHDFGSGAVDALQITLTNTSPTTSVRTDLLTGLFWSLTGVGPLSTASTGFDGLAPTVRTSDTTSVSNVDIAPALRNTATEGTYMLSDGPFGAANNGQSYAHYAYAITTVGFGLTGLNGSNLNGDNYGIAAADSSLAKGGMASAVPVIDATATFWMLRPAELVSVNQVSAVAFVFGSQPDTTLDSPVPGGPTAVPEPTSLILFGTGLLGLAGSLRRKCLA